MEWTYTDVRDKQGLFGVAVVLVMCFLTVRGALTADSTAFGWATHWQIWLFLAIAGLFMVWLGGKATRLAAGADWFMKDTVLVKTYELTSVRLGKSWDKDGEVIFHDRHGHDVQVDLGTLRVNHNLWDLVYNGIVHSVAAGASVDAVTIQKLRLHEALAARERGQGQDQ